MFQWRARMGYSDAVQTRYDFFCHKNVRILPGLWGRTRSDLERMGSVSTERPQFFRRILPSESRWTYSKRRAFWPVRCALRAYVKQQFQKRIQPLTSMRALPPTQHGFFLRYAAATLQRNCR